jgi:hypothetical protein
LVAAKARKSQTLLSGGMDIEKNIQDECSIALAIKSEHQTAGLPSSRLDDDSVC